MTIEEVKQLIEQHIARYREGMAKARQDIKDLNERLVDASGDKDTRIRIGLYNAETLIDDYSGRIGGLSILLAEIKQKEREEQA